jgi:hypothetical protein
MFGMKHYVPILKWKRAERGALTAVNNKQKSYITPLVQLVMPKSKPPEEDATPAQLEMAFNELISKFRKNLPKIPGEIVKAWGTAPIFVDASLLYTTTLKAESLDLIVATGNTLGAVFIPVLYLDDDRVVQEVASSIAKTRYRGLCLRLIRTDFVDASRLRTRIDLFLKTTGLAEENVDLLVDLKEISANGEGTPPMPAKVCSAVPSLSKWRTFVFGGGAFPKDLSGCKIDEENLIPRLDWNAWKKEISDENLERKPAFADYTIQHPVYLESTQFFHPTTSIKYTLENEWFVMKGQRQKYELYLASAAELVKDGRYAGENFSEGDKYIAEKAKHFPVYVKKPAVGGTGTAETWIRAGISHHVALVVSQLSSLP